MQDGIAGRFAAPRSMSILPPDPARRGPSGGGRRSRMAVDLEEVRPDRVMPAAPERRRPAPRLGLFAAGFGTFSVAVGLVAGLALARADLGAAGAHLAAFAGAAGGHSGLELGRVAARRDVDRGRPVLVVAGEIANTGRSERSVPELLLTIRSSGAAATQPAYEWRMRPARPVLAPGETIGFESRLAAPAVHAGTIEVRFAGTARTNAAAE